MERPGERGLLSMLMRLRPESIGWQPHGNPLDFCKRQVAGIRAETVTLQVGRRVDNSLSLDGS